MKVLNQIGVKLNKDLNILSWYPNTEKEEKKAKKRTGDETKAIKLLLANKVVL